MSLLPALVLLVSLIGAAPAAAVTCTPTGFFRDGIDMTAALINPASVPAVVDATGCNVGVYYDSGNRTLTGKEIFGANYFGVLVNGDAGNVVVHISNNQVHNIGEVPFNGTQHGVGIYLRSFFTFTITGEVTGNTVTAYQKGGIVLNGKGVKLTDASNNDVQGLGHLAFIAQNGLQIGYGAMPYPSQVLNNRVSANSYVGFPGDGSASGGILVVGGPGYGTCPDSNPCPYTTTVLIGINSALNAVGQNKLFNNDVGVYSSNLDATFAAPATPTYVLIVGSLAGDDICYNTSYQAGISDQGNNDFILYNYIQGDGGYGASCPSAKQIDVSGSISPVLFGNNVPVTTSAGASSLASSPRKLKAVPEKP